MAVKTQTKDTADLMGFTDRGTLEVGKRADVNVIDLEALTLASRTPPTTFPPAVAA